jgi:predicted ATPase/DNA-binding XRE family transcriptional regulator
LRSLRLRAGLTQEALAERAGVSVATIGAIEEGQRRRPYPHTLRALADSLELSAADRAALISPPDEGAPAEAPSLPVPTTALFGRAAEVASACELLGSVRLLTLIGPGGVGKTRLSLEVAPTVQNAFTDGVVFVDLAPVREHRLVPATIARLLGVRESGGRSAWELLLAHLRPRHMLLVLDNFEHVLGAAPLLTELLAACPRLVILVTSRTALRLRPERRFALGPLAVPTSDESLALAEVAASPAVQLFVDRLRAVTPEFLLESANARAVAGICRQLDGIPLALELAAARAHLLTPAALLQRLEHRLSVLSGGPVDLPERQRTLRNTLAWSYDLLEPADRALFRRLAVFAGGWTLEAAEAVCSDTQLPVEDVLERLSVLVDSSLVRRSDQHDGEPRFVMLETVREYALERLQAEGEEETVRGRHLAFCLALAEAGEPHLDGAEQMPWADRLEREHDNLRAALGWAARGPQPLPGLKLAIALRFFWYTRGHFREGRDRLMTALAAAEASADLATRGRGQATLGYMLAVQGQVAEARARLETALTISRGLGDEAGTAFALRYLGLVASAEADYETAGALVEESLALSRKLGMEIDIAHALMYMGDFMLQRGDHQRAQAFFEESGELLRRLQNMTVLSYPLRRLALLARLRGDLPLAVRLCLQSLEHNREVGENQGVAACLVGLACIAEAQGETRRGVEFLSKADELLSAMGSQLLPFDREQLELALARLRGKVDPAVWAEAWRAGQRLTLDEAVTASLRLGGPGPTA